MPQSTTMAGNGGRQILGILALGALCLALYGPPAVQTPFFTKGEPREALVVKHMVTDGAWILPQRPSADGWTIASKPPLFHWLAALTAKATGRTSEMAIRLPSLVLASATVILVWVVGAPILGTRPAFLGAVMLATAFEWMNAAQTARVDATLTAFMTFALLIFYRAMATGALSRRAALVAYGCLAAAALAKGPVGFVLPVLVVAMAMLVSQDRSLLTQLRPGLGAVVIVGIVGCWYLAAWATGGEPFFEKLILKENVFRFLGGGGHDTGHEHGLLYYLPGLALGLLPWSPVLVGALIAACRNGPERREPRLGFLLAWLVTVFVFYSLSSGKRSIYLLALYPAAALLCGWWVDRLTTTAAPRWLSATATRVVQRGLCAVLAVPLAVSVLELLGARPLDLFVPLLHPKDLANLPLVRSVIQERGLLVVLTLSLLVGSLALAFRWLREAEWLRAFGATAVLATTLWVLIFSVFRPEIAERRSLAGFMRWATAETERAELYFYPPSFDFGAAFYAPDGVGYLPDAAGTARWVLIWDVDFAVLAPEERARLEILRTSEGTDPKGKRHMMLARLRTGRAEPKS